MIQNTEAFPPRPEGTSSDPCAMDRRPRPPGHGPNWITLAGGPGCACNVSWLCAGAVALLCLCSAPVLPVVVQGDAPGGRSGALAAALAVPVGCAAGWTRCPRRPALCESGGGYGGKPPSVQIRWVLGNFCGNIPDPSRPQEGRRTRAGRADLPPASGARRPCAP